MSEPEITPSDLKFRCERGMRCVPLRRGASVTHGFFAVQINKQLPASIAIYNPGTQRLAFKVRSQLS